MSALLSSDGGLSRLIEHMTYFRFPHSFLTYHSVCTVQDKGKCIGSGPMVTLNYPFVRNGALDGARSVQAIPESMYCYCTTLYSFLTR